MTPLKSFRQDGSRSGTASILAGLNAGRIGAWSVKTVQTALLSYLLVTAGTVACQAADAQLQAVFEERYAAMKSAMAARNASGIAALLTEDFVSIEVSGSQKTRDQMIEAVKALPGDPNKVSNTSILSIEASPSKALVKQRYDMKTVRPSSDGAKHQVELTTLSTDVWVLKNGTWLLKQTATDQLDYSADGQALAHKVRTSGP
jgi:hypothetical protein